MSDGTFARDPMRRITAEEFDFAVEDLLGQGDGVGKSLLPVDEVTAGYSNNSVISLQTAQVEKYQDVARQVAEKAITDLTGLLACARGATEEDCALAFIEGFGKRALRRPLEEEELALFTALYKKKRDEVGHAQGIRLFLETILQFPSFMYRPVIGVATTEPAVRKLTGYEIASRLSFFLWSSVPDDELLAAAEKGDLDTSAGIRNQAERLIADPRFDRSMASFSLQWLDVGVNPPSKNPAEFPNFTPQVWDSQRAGVAMYFAHAARNGGDLATLMTGNYAFVDQNLAGIYGTTTKSTTLQRVEMPTGKRAGLMTQAGVMAALGTSAISRPIRRGLFVRNRIFCQDPPPPPPEGVPAFEGGLPSQTIRQQLEEHRANPTCANCHAFFDPPGLAFEHYDGVGTYHDKDPRNGQEIDSSGELSGTDVDGAFDDAIGLMDLTKDSALVSQCLSTQVFRFAVGRLEEEGADTCAMESVLKQFAKDGQSLPGLFTSIATSDPFRFTGSP